jgi:hypothetical protein
MEAPPYLPLRVDGQGVDRSGDRPAIHPGCPATPPVEPAMNPPFVQIAAAFLVAIGACASLIISANAKHERLSRLFRATCTDWRTASAERKDNLRRQAEYFRARYYVIREVQTRLFGALRSFVMAFFFFVGLGITASAETYLSAQQSQVQRWAGGASIGFGLVIAGFFVYGLVLMMKASGRQLEELKHSHQTLEAEAEDVLGPLPGGAVRVAGLIG